MRHIKDIEQEKKNNKDPIIIIEMIVMGAISMIRGEDNETYKRYGIGKKSNNDWMIVMEVRSFCL